MNPTTQWTDKDDAMFREWAGEGALVAAIVRHPDFRDDIADPVVEACMRRRMRIDALREWGYRIGFAAVIGVGFRLAWMAAARWWPL
jgi:hypothetical protein